MIGARGDECRCLHLRGDHSRNEGECLHDECACDLFRARAPRPIGSYAIGQGRRKHAPPRIGQRFGSWRVVRLLGRGYRGRSDLRVEVECSCGKRSETYEFNLRTHRGRACYHVRRRAS